MNGRKAKMLRRLAGVNAKETQQYTTIKHTQRNREFKNLLGETIGRITTGTLQLASGPRALYKFMKKGYKQGALRPAVA